MRIIFLDLDGVINSGNKGREHLVPAKNQMGVNAAWRDWHAAHVSARPNEAMIAFIQQERRAGAKVVVLSSRHDEFIAATARQLAGWGCLHDVTVLRSPGDNRAQETYKQDTITSYAHALWLAGEKADFVLIDDNTAICDAVMAQAKGFAMCGITLSVVNPKPFNR